MSIYDTIKQAADFDPDSLRLNSGEPDNRTLVSVEGGALVEPHELNADDKAKLLRLLFPSISEEYYNSWMELRK